MEILSSSKNGNMKFSSSSLMSIMRDWQLACDGNINFEMDAKRNREGGSGMGKLIQSELSVLDSQPVHEYELLEDVKKHYAVRITFRMQITADVDIQWDTIMSGRKLYIQVADAQRPVGSKEGFLAMLEYAEEYLNVSHIIVCFAKNHPERNVLVRGFMFLGFSLQPPGLNKIVPHAAIDNCNHYMVYDVES